MLLPKSDNIFKSSYIVPLSDGVMIIDVVDMYPVTLFNVVPFYSK